MRAEIKKIRTIITFILALVFNMGTYATVYHTAQNGNYGSASTWVGGVVPNLLTTSNEIYIDHDVTLGAGNTEMNCYMEVGIGHALITINQWHVNQSTGHFVTWGYVDIKNNLYPENGGKVEVMYGGLINVNRVINDNAGIIELHGGTICYKIWLGYPPTGIGVVLNGKCYGSIGPLALSLISFEVSWSDDHVNIRWVTENEDQNDHFTVQKSDNLYNWETVASVPGALVSQGLKEYIVSDDKASPGIHYYKLSVTDVNGNTVSFGDSWIRFANCPYIKENENHVNVVTDRFSLQNSCCPDEPFFLHDFSGRLFLKGIAKSGETIVDLTSLSPGFYVLTTGWGKNFRILKTL